MNTLLSYSSKTIGEMALQTCYCTIAAMELHTVVPSTFTLTEWGFDDVTLRFVCYGRRSTAY